MQRNARFFLLVFLTVIAGCGQGKQTQVAENSSTVVKPDVVASQPVATKTEDQPHHPELVATAINGTAEATFQQTLVAFQDGRLDKAFDFLPESYQSDVESVVHDFADKMDAELWAKSFELLNKISNILKTKKTLILGMDNIKNTPQFESIKPVWDDFTQGIHEVANGEISNLAKLKRSQMRSLLMTANRLLVAVPRPQFGDVTVKTVSSHDQTTTLSYRESKSAEPRQVEFVKVEGKWLPKSIATGWSAGIADAKRRLANLPDSLSSAKPEMLQKLDEVGVMLDQLQQAKSAADFNRAMVPLIMAMKFGTLWVEQTMQDTQSPRKGTAVHLVIDRELSDDEQTKLKNAVIESLDDPQIEYEMIPSDGKTRCRFTPIPDKEALVVVLQKHFDMASVRFDPAKKSILVELK